MQLNEVATVHIHFENASVIGRTARERCSVEGVADQNHAAFGTGTVRQTTEDAIPGAIGVDFENCSVAIRAAAGSRAIKCCCSALDRSGEHSRRGLGCRNCEGHCKPAQVNESHSIPA